jgi:hypothetical protein
MRESSNRKSGGVGFCGLLAILFIGLKLGGVIAWSWLWVLSPLWITICFWLVIVGVAVVVLEIAEDAKGTRR